MGGKNGCFWCFERILKHMKESSQSLLSPDPLPRRREGSTLSSAGQWLEDKWSVQVDLTVTSWSNLHLFVLFLLKDYRGTVGSYGNSWPKYNSPVKNYGLEHVCQNKCSP